MVYFTADTHFFDEKIFESCNRPFSSVEEMNAKLIEGWNSRVGRFDTVYHLGDFGIGNIEQLTEIREQLNGYIILYLGDQDYSISEGEWLHIVKIDDVRKLEKNFSFALLISEAPIIVKNTAFNICHYPYVEDCEEDQSIDYKLTDDGLPLLCGHVHDKWKSKGNQYNVGVDGNNFVPKTIEEILNIKEE